MCRWLKVVICLKNRTFAVSQTTCWINKTLNHCCDLLEKSYFCSIANNVFRQDFARIPSCDLLEKSYFCSIANNSVFSRLLLDVL